MMACMARLTPEERRRAGDAVEARRQELALTQHQLARRAHVASDRVGVIERAEEWPQTRTRKAIEAALGWREGTLLRIARGEDPEAQVAEDESAESAAHQQIRKLMSEVEDLLLAGRIEWARTAFTEAVEVAERLQGSPRLPSIHEVLGHAAHDEPDDQ